MVTVFTPASRTETKIAMGLMGPSGAGKTLTSLQIMRAIVGPEGRIAVIDTERGRGNEYVGSEWKGITLDYDIAVLGKDKDKPYHPQKLIDLMEQAIEADYDGLIIDSYSLFWQGDGGMLDIAEAGGGYPKGWKIVGDWEKKIADVLFGNRIHVICTLRVKMDYAVVDDPTRPGKTRVEKLGLKAEQRPSLEYDFPFLAHINQDSAVFFDKPSSLQELRTQGPFLKNGDTIGALMRGWIDGGADIRMVDGQIVRDEEMDLSDTSIVLMRNFRVSVGVAATEEALESLTAQVSILIGDEGATHVMRQLFTGFIPTASVVTGLIKALKSASPNTTKLITELNKRPVSNGQVHETAE